LQSGQPSGLRRVIGRKRLVVLIGLVALVALSWYLRKQGLLDPHVIQSLIVEHPIVSPIVFILLYAVGTLSALPTVPANLAAGLFWGPVLGGILSTTGATLGAILAFAAARSIFGRPLAERFGNRYVAEMQREFENRGWVFLAFARLNPVFPTGVLNYLLGLTSIDTFTYVWVTFAFILPPSIAVALIGQSVGTFVVEGEISDSLKVMLTVSAAVTVLTALAYGASLLQRMRMRASERKDPIP
jgi:uncharacterized membrane protein YdjX (TVP38/TMEM64 family)